MSVKIHQHLVQSIVDCLINVFVDQYYADKVIDHAFKNNKKWGARDRKFVAEAVYEIVRHWRFLWALNNVSNLEAVDAQDREALERIFWIWFQMKNNQSINNSFVDWVNIQKKLEQNYPRAVKHSLPDWLDELLANDIGPLWDEILPSLNVQAKVVLRCNTLKTDVVALQKKLRSEEVECRILPDYPDALILDERKNVFVTKSFHEGLFEVQDGASQTVAPMLQVEPGMRVIDACAGAGGKTLHLAALMKNKGKIIALDISQRKLDELQKRARRAGVDIIETRCIESSKTIKRLADSADRLLLDVPCTGLGVLRRNPDTKWKLKQDQLSELLETQNQILSSYTKMLRANSKALYATCSILKQENEMQVQNFITNHSGWKLEEEKRHWPHIDKMDGFFAARISN